MHSRPASGTNPSNMDTGYSPSSHSHTTPIASTSSTMHILNTPKSQTHILNSPNRRPPSSGGVVLSPRGTALLEQQRPHTVAAYSKPSPRFHRAQGTNGNSSIRATTSPAQQGRGHVNEEKQQHQPHHPPSLHQLQSPSSIPSHATGTPIVLTWSVASFQSFFPLLSFHDIQQAMISVVPNFVAVGPTSGPSKTSMGMQPTHEQVQMTVTKLSEMSAKRLQMMEHKARIEERQTERRWKIFYERPTSRSERFMHLKTGGEPPVALQFVPPSVMAAAGTSLPSSPAATLAHSQQPTSGSAGTLAATHSRRGSHAVAGVSPLSPSGGNNSGGGHSRNPSSSTNHSRAGGGGGHAHSVSALGGSHGHRRTASSATRGRTGSTLSPLFANSSSTTAPLPNASVANSFFSLDFLAPVPPRNPVSEWLESTPSAPTSYDDEKELQSPKSGPTSPTTPNRPRSSAMDSPRFNRHAKLLALSPEHARVHTPSENYLAPPTTVVSTTVAPILTQAQEQALLHFLQASHDCPFFASSLSGFSIPSILNSYDLNHMISFVLAPKYTAAHELVPTMFNIMNDLIDVNEELSRTFNRPVRSYPSWHELLTSLRAIFQLGRQKYVDVIHELQGLRVKFNQETTLNLSEEDLVQVLEQGGVTQDGIYSPSHLISILTGFMTKVGVLPASSSSASTSSLAPSAAATTTSMHRKFRSLSELIFAIRANLTCTLPARAEIFALPATIQPRSVQEFELFRKVNHILDLYILGGSGLRAAVERIQATSKRRQLMQVMAAEEAAASGNGTTPSSVENSPAIYPKGLKSVTDVLFLGTPKAIFFALLAALHSSPSSAASTLYATGSLDSMFLQASGGGLLDITEASLKNFTARLQVEQRLMQYTKEGDETDLISSGVVLPLQSTILRYLNEKNIWQGKMLEQRHFIQLLHSVPPACGGSRLLYYVLTRHNFMYDDQPSSGGSDSSEPKYLPSFVKFKAFLRHVRMRCQELQNDARKILAFLESQGEPWRTFFPEQLGSSSSATVEGEFQLPPPLLTLVDCTHLILNANCTNSNEVLTHLRSLVTFGRSFSRLVDSSSTSSNCVNLFHTLTHAVRVYSTAQEHRVKLEQYDLLWELELFFSNGNHSLFVSGKQPVNGATIEGWLDSINRIFVQHSASSLKLPPTPQSHLPFLLLILHHFLSQGHHFVDVSSLTHNIIELTKQYGSILKDLTRSLYSLASTYSEHNCPNPLLLSLQTQPNTVEKIFYEGFGGFHSVSLIRKLQELAEKDLTQKAEGQPIDPSTSTVEVSESSLCTWQTVPEVIACLQTLTRQLENERLRVSPSSGSLLNLLETHLPISSWSCVEFVSTLANQHPTNHPLLHSAVAATLKPQDYEKLYEKLYSFLSLVDIVRLPSIVWELTCNLPSTIPTTGSQQNFVSRPDSGTAVRSIMIGGQNVIGGELESRKFLSLDDLCSTLLMIRQQELKAELARIAASTSSNQIDFNSPALVSLVSELEEYLINHPHLYFTPETVASPTFDINKQHVQQILQAIQQEGLIARDQHSASRAGQMPLPAFEFEDIISRLNALVEEHLLFQDWHSFIDMIQAFKYVSPIVKQIYSVVRGTVFLKITTGNGSGMSCSTRLLDSASQAGLSFYDIQYLLHDTDTNDRPNELLSLLRALDSANSGDSGTSIFDSFYDSLVPSVRTILSVNRAKRIEQELQRSLLRQQQQQQSQHTPAVSQRSTPVNPKSRGGSGNQTSFAEAMESAENASIVQLSNVIQRISPHLFYQAQAWNLASEDENENEDQQSTDGNTKAHQMGTLPTAAIQLLLSSVGASNPTLAGSTALYFLQYLLHDYSSSSVSSTSYVCSDLSELTGKFSELAWKKEWIIRQLISAVITKRPQRTSNSGSSRTKRQDSNGGNIDHDWTLLYNLFTNHAPGLQTLTFLPILNTILPDYTTLSSFIDGLRLLYTQSFDEFHEPALTQLNNSLQTKFSQNRLIDPAKFEATLLSLKGFWSDGCIERETVANDVAMIESNLDVLAKSAPAYTNIFQLLAAYRFKFYQQPYELTRDVLSNLAQERCMLWSWNTDKRELELRGHASSPSSNHHPLLPLNYLTLYPYVHSIGSTIHALFERCEHEGTSFASLDDLFSTITTIDLLVAPSEGWRARFDASQPPPPPRVVTPPPTSAPLATVAPGTPVSPSIAGPQPTAADLAAHEAALREAEEVHQAALQAAENVFQVALQEAHTHHQTELETLLQTHEKEIHQKYSQEQETFRQQLIASHEAQLKLAQEEAAAALERTKLEEAERYSRQKSESDALVRRMREIQEQQFRAELERLENEKLERERQVLELQQQVHVLQKSMRTGLRLSRHESHLAEQQAAASSPMSLTPPSPNGQQRGRANSGGPSNGRLSSRASAAAANDVSPPSPRTPQEKRTPEASTATTPPSK